LLNKSIYLKKVYLSIYLWLYIPFVGPWPLFSFLIHTESVELLGRARVWSCGIYGGHNDAGAGFLRVLRFPLPIFIPPIAPKSPSPIIWGWYNKPEVAAVQGT
jgi:hypothetical protein